jgi:hypothetical protein
MTTTITRRLKSQIRHARKQAATARRLEFRLRAEGRARAYATVLRWVEADDRRNTQSKSEGKTR